MSYLARFLLVTPDSGGEEFGYSFQPGEWLDSYIPYYKPYDERVGTPLGPLYPTNGCYTREFANALVYVNTSETSPTTITIPAGWHYYPYTNATQYDVADVRVGTNTPYTLNQMEGIVLFKKVSVDQKLEDGTTSIDSVGHWYQNHFVNQRMPKEIPMALNTNEVLRGAQKVDNSQGPQKYNKWNRDNNVMNHRPFSVASIADPIISNFKSTHPGVVIRNELIDAPTVNGGMVEFKDPWLVDTTDARFFESPYGYRNLGMGAPYKQEQSLPFTPGTSSKYKGVFLNESGPINNWNPPYYSVGAPNPNYINGFTSYFLNWDNSNTSQVEFQYPNSQQSGVVFKQSGATAVAKYKAHLASSSTLATGPNTQRKVIRDDDGIYHMVYESASRVWYSRSRDDGATWSAEKMLDYYGATCRAPSVTYQVWFGRKLLVTFEAYDHDGGTIVVYAIDPGTGAITDISPYPYVELLPPLPCPPANPMLATSNRNKGLKYQLLVWSDTKGRLVGRMCNQEDGIWSSDHVEILPHVEEFSLAPLVYEPWHLVWQEGGTLWYSGLPIQEIPTLGPVEEVTNGGATDYPPQHPTVVDRGGKPSVAWQVFNYDNVTWTIYYRQKNNSGNWDGTTTVIYSEEGAEKPSLGVNVATEDVGLAWRSNLNSVSYLRRINGTWFNGGSFGEGDDPMMSNGYYHYGYAGNERLLWRCATGQPYQLRTTSISLSGGPQGGKMSELTAGELLNEGRGGKIVFSDGSISFAILCPTLDTTHISFGTLRDSLPVTRREDFEAALRTSDFVGQGALSLQILLKRTGMVPRNAGLHFQLRDARTDQTISTLRTLRGESDSTVILRLALAHGSRRVRLAVQPVAIPENARYAVERWLHVPSTQQATLARLNPTGAGSHETISPPTEFALHANYPNPFNPSTQINFDLPEAANVSLVIYDVLGRKVAELVNGQVEAGYRSVTWNAANAASGVYFARFTATNPTGEVKLTKVNKLLLTK